MFFIVYIVGHSHYQNGEQAAQQSPYGDIEGGGLIEESGPVAVAPPIQGRISNECKYSASGQTAPEPAIASSGGGGQHRGCAVFGFQGSKEGSAQHNDGEVYDEHEEANQAYQVEHGLDLPDLVAGIQFDGGVKSGVEELHAGGDYALGEVCPGMDDFRIINYTDGLLAVDFLCIHGIA